MLPPLSINNDAGVDPSTADKKPTRRSNKTATPTSKQTNRHVNECRCYGPTITIGNTALVSSTDRPLYLTDLADYTVVTNCDFTDYIKFAPTSLKAAVRNNWIYVVHVSPTIRMAVTRATLQARVTGGEILAYQYSECSIEGNDCVYYGFLPTERHEIADTHKRCLLSAMQVWPRKLYVYLRKETACICSPGCSRWSLKLRDHTVRRFCIQQLPWDDVYIMMGDMDETCVEEIKEPRQCPVCAQCLKCANSPVYCRTHRKCKHKKVKIYDPDTMMPLSLPVIKRCRKIRRVK